MSDDGAQLGYGAEDAMKAVIGGEQPTKVTSAGEMGARIMALTEDTYEHTYDGTADWTANRIISWLMQDPQRAQSPTENVYGVRDDGTTDYETIAVPGWYDRMKDDGFDLSELGLSGFMWGWAVNAARRMMELPEVSNPAIVSL